MNRTYRIVWSEARNGWVVCAEITRTHGKRSVRATVAAALLAPMLAYATLPTGGQIVAGSGTISQSGNTMTITQTSDKLAANWQSFSIGAGHAVHFVQPSALSVALNRVLGSDVSVIQGALKANGQVFLINPNGVLFTPTAQVEVGSLVASTRNLSDDDFLAGRYRFAGDSLAKIRNEGNIQVAPGGAAAFVAARIENAGTIGAPQGQVLMGAGNRVKLDLGGPVAIEVEEGALQALIDQGGAIRADGGLVYLTAKAASALRTAVINHSGITEAKSLGTDAQGRIYLMGDMAQGEVKVAGTLNAEGGFVETSAARVKVEDGAQVKAGHWLIDPTDVTIASSCTGITTGCVNNVALSNSLNSGDVTIATSDSGDEFGDIYVEDNVTWSSGKTLTLRAHADIFILATLDASNGSGGKVVLEYGQGSPDGTFFGGIPATYSFGLTPSGFTGKINLQPGQNFSTKLGSNGTRIDYTVITELGNPGDESNPNANNSLQGLAHSSKLSGNYALGADIDASATSTWNQSGSSHLGFVPIGNYSQNDPNVSFTGRFDGLGHTITGLTINRPSTDYVGLFGATNDADLGNVGLVGGSVTGKDYVGRLVGSNNNSTIIQSYATGNVTGNDYVGGLVGDTEDSIVIQSYATGNVTGNDYVGGLSGDNFGNSTIIQSYATGNVTGNDHVGGLSGDNFENSTIIQSYATGNVTGNNYVGGLVGSNISLLQNHESPITQSYATGNVTGNNYVGGLVGSNLQNSSITESYAIGSVTGNNYVGGLVGNNVSTITNSFYAKTDTGGSSINNGGTPSSVWSGNNYGTAKTLADLKQLSTFSAWGQNIDDQGDTAAAWRIYDGHTTPLLRWALIPLTVAPQSGSRVYDGTTNHLGLIHSIDGETYVTGLPSHNIYGTATVTGVTSPNVGAYTLTVSGLYSDQQGYDISYESGSLQITRRPVTVTADPKSKTQGQADPALTYTTGCGGASAPCGLVPGETLSGSLVRDPGENLGTYAIRQGTVDDAHNPNYSITYVGANLTITADTAMESAITTAQSTALSMGSTVFDLGVSPLGVQSSLTLQEVLLDQAAPIGTASPTAQPSLLFTRESASVNPAGLITIQLIEDGIRLPKQGEE